MVVSAVAVVVEVAAAASVIVDGSRFNVLPTLNHAVAYAMELDLRELQPVLNCCTCDFMLRSPVLCTLLSNCVN